MTPDPTPIVPDVSSPTTSASERQSSSWDIRNAPRNYLSLVAAQAGSAAFSFGAVWLITRYLGSEGYGGVVAVIAASQVVQVLVNWTGIAVVRFGVDEFIETEKIARTFWVRLIVLSINLVLVLLFAWLWFPPLAAWLRLSPDVLWLVVIHFVVTALWIHVQMSLQAAKLLRHQGILQMVERLLILLGIVGFLLAEDLTVRSAMVCYIAGPATMTAVGTVLLKPYIFTKFSIDRTFLRKILAYSLPLLPMSLVGYFSGSYLDAVFVSHFLSTSDLGVYSVATQINGIVLQLPTLANGLLISLFITLQKEEKPRKIQRFFHDLLPSCVLLGGVACTLIAFSCWVLIPLVFGLEFAESTSTLWILLVASTTALPVLFGYSALAQAKSATFILMIASVFAALGNITFDFLLIPSFGLSGCAWATVASCFIGSFTYSLLLKARFKIPLSWVYLAMFPSVVAGVSLTLTESVRWALLVCFLSAFLITFFQRSSIRTAIELSKNFRRTPKLTTQ